MVFLAMQWQFILSHHISIALIFIGLTDFGLDKKTRFFFFPLKIMKIPEKNKKNVQKLLYLRHSMNNTQLCSLSLIYEFGTMHT